MQSLIQLVEELQANFPQDFVPLKMTNTSTGLTAPSRQPLYLFRGERNANWETTKSTFSRFGELGLDFLEVNYWITGIQPQLYIPYEHQSYSLYFFLREALLEDPLLSIPLDAELELYIVGILQHYGFATSFLDVTDDVMVAAAFASMGKPLDTGQIMVLETKGIEDQYFDLAKVPGNRPTAQHAYGLWGSQALDLKSPDFSETYNPKWYSFQLTPEDKLRFSTSAILDLSGDQIVGHILEWYHCHIERNTTISVPSLTYFHKIVSQLGLTPNVS